MIIDHIGIAVRSIERSLEHWQAVFGYRQETEIVTNTLQKSVDTELVRLEALGLRAIGPPQPGEAFEGERIAFVYAGDGLNIELIDTGRRAGRLLEEPAAPGATEI